jgi:hypothetical protein
MLRGSYVENGDHAYVARLSLSEGPAPDHVEIDDSQFLFSAHFKKAGADLVLTGDDGHRLVLVDYFNLAKRPDLTSHGATMSADLVTHLAGPDAPGQYAQAGAPAGAQVIGKCERISGGATVQHANGVVEEIKAGDAVLNGDVVMTNDGSAAVLSLIDGTVFNMGASARMVLNELIYDANSTSNSALISLVKGTFTFVGGHVAHTGDMKLDTPVATMGIRGTAGTTTINADATGTVYEVSFSLMPDPDGHVGLIHVLDRVTGLVIGTISTTANVLSVQPTANFQIIANESPKAAAQVQAELAAAQVLYPCLPGGCRDGRRAAGTAGADRPARPAAEHPAARRTIAKHSAANWAGRQRHGNRRCGYRRGDCHQNSGRPDTHRHAADSDPAQSDGHHAHSPSRAPGPDARDHRDHAAASARAGSGSARNTRFGREPDGHRPDRHQCLGKRGMGRPRRRAVNLLPEGLRAWDGVSRHQQFHPDLFAQRRRPERGGAAARAACLTATPRSLTNFTASTLNSRV